jgi:protein SCO1
MSFMRKIILGLGLAVATLGGSYIAFNHHHADSTVIAGADGKATNIATSGDALIGGAFNLTNTQGKLVQDADFRGKHMLVFFGFTQCPDVCPLTLTTISSVMDELGADANKVTPIFITIDPERDSPEIMQQYLVAFHPAIQGLTGTHKDIKQAVKAYKVYTQYDKTDAEAGYDVMHSGYVYFMDGAGKYITHFSHDDSVDTIHDAVKKAL